MDSTNSKQRVQEIKKKTSFFKDLLESNAFAEERSL